MKSEYCQGLFFPFPGAREREREGKIGTVGTRLEIACPSSSQQVGSKSRNEEYCVTSVLKETHAAHTISPLQEGKMQLVGACTIQRKLG